ncbi:hypothetical protein D5086_033032 [Populus alba]|uniref:Uncharacterized protein n=1 Tax=Populus alba TaxID=43335 RepID=A0ACC4AFR7_POPAL
MASDGNKNKPLDREVRDMVNNMTRRIVDQFHKPSASLHNQESVADEDGHGIRIVTLAGTNTGASMRSELDDQKSNKLLEPTQGLTLIAISKLLTILSCLVATTALMILVFIWTFGILMMNTVDFVLISMERRERRERRKTRTRKLPKVTNILNIQIEVTEEENRSRRFKRK